MQLSIALSAPERGGSSDGDRLGEDVAGGLTHPDALLWIYDFYYSINSRAVTKVNPPLTLPLFQEPASAVEPANINWKFAVSSLLPARLCDKAWWFLRPSSLCDRSSRSRFSICRCRFECTSLFDSASPGTSDVDTVWVSELEQLVTRSKEKPSSNRGIGTPADYATIPGSSGLSPVVRHCPNSPTAEQENVG